MPKPVTVGAVLYDPKVAVIWEIIRDFFEENGQPLDVIFYSNYNLQVKALMDRELDMAWNSPLAWLDSQRRSSNRCRAIAMRDTDRDRVSHIVVQQDADAGRLEDLRGATVAVGAKDSPQSRLIPLGLLQRHGMEPENDFKVMGFDVLVGKHGDHIGGELDAYKALEAGTTDACAMVDLNWDTWTRDGTIDASSFRVLASTERFDHCVFTVGEGFEPGREADWLEVLYSMSYDNPDHREMMDMEGLKEWLPGRTTGFGPLSEAIQQQHFFDNVQP